MSRVFIPIAYDKFKCDATTFESQAGALFLKSITFGMLPAGTTPGDVMTWNGSAWESSPAGGGGGGLTFDQAAAMAAFVGDFA